MTGCGCCTCLSPLQSCLRDGFGNPVKHRRKGGAAWPKTIFLVRHGESTYNEHYKEHGTDPLNFWDAPLTSNGQAQARGASRALAAHGSVSLALVSPLSRAVQTCLLALPPDGVRAERYEVTELLSEHLEASCDIGKPPAELRGIFPELDFSALPDVWWYVPEEHRTGITPEGSRDLFANCGRREPSSSFVERVDAVAAMLARRSESTIALFGHADFFNAFLRRHFARHDAQYKDKWMDNCEVVCLQVAQASSLLHPDVPAEIPATVPVEPPSGMPEAVPRPRSQSVSSIGLASLRSELAEQNPNMKPGELMKLAAQRWKALDAEGRARYMSFSSDL